LNSIKYLNEYIDKCFNLKKGKRSPATDFMFEINNQGSRFGEKEGSHGFVLELALLPRFGSLLTAFSYGDLN
jgi:hypothetical protein